MRALTDANLKKLKEIEEKYRTGVTFGEILRNHPEIFLDVMYLMCLIYRLEDDLRLLQAKERSL